MSRKEEELSKGSGDSFNVTIGNQASDIAIGKNIQQIRESSRAKLEITETDLAEINHLFVSLKEVITKSVPLERQHAALERVEELEETVSAKKPDLTTIEYVKNWFVKNLPQVAGNVIGLLVHPIVGKVVEAAGDLAAGELKRRFENPTD